MMRSSMAWILIIGIAAAALAAVNAHDDEAVRAPDSMARPQYDDEGRLVITEGYREWIYVGSSLGLSYSENVRGDGPGLFHHVYIQPEAYTIYKETGKFPEKTMLAMENYSAGSKVEPNLHGNFEDKLVGLEFAVKDAENIEDGWGYFNFTNGDKPFKKTAKAFPRGLCYNCHVEHARDDNVFVQFYPALRELKFEPSDKFGEEE